MSGTCTCGHAGDEHETTGSFPCTIDGCPCFAYEADEGDDD